MAGATGSARPLVLAGLGAVVPGVVDEVPEVVGAGPPFTEVLSYNEIISCVMSIALDAYITGVLGLLSSRTMV